MKCILIIFIYLGCATLSYCSHPEPKEYFVRSCEFVCDYPFSDTSKWVITCRVWGLLKYYHPNVTAGKLDWDKVLLDRLDGIESSSTPEMVDTELKKMLTAAGEYDCKKDTTWDDSLNMNVNLCWIDHSFLDEPLKNELKKISSLAVKYPSYYGMDINTVRRSFLPQHEKTYDDINIYTSFEYRLLALFRYWNVIYYFYPHKYLMDKSWDKTIAESIFPFIKATNEQSYKIAFLKLAASLNDGHAFINFGNYYPDESHDIIEKVDGKTISRIDAGEIKKGDIINCIGERNINLIRDSLSVLIPASTQGNKEYRINCSLAEMIFFHETDITVLRNGNERKVHIQPVSFEKKNFLCPYKDISDNTGYVDLSILTTDQIDLMFQYFSNAKSIIFDLRKAGSYNFDLNALYCHLSNKKNIQLFNAIIFDLEHPGAFWWKQNTYTDIPDGCNRFSGKIVFLVNEFTQSSLETITWVVHNNFHATLIGRTTSGALGQVVWIPLPGNQSAAFSGFGLFSLDKIGLQRKGIIPDLEVYPTVESIKDGKDEILDKAIEYINNH